MSPIRTSASLLPGLRELNASWGWFVGLGLLLMLLGIICVIGDVTATFVTIMAFGWFLIFGGIVSLIHAIRVHTWSGFFLSLASALLRGFTGYFLLRYPGAGAVAITVLLSAFFIVSGVFRAAGAGVLRFPSWGWAMFSGIVSVVLGVMLLRQMPVSSLWFIGFAVGIDLILEGASLVSFGMALHRVPEAISYDKAA
jgi:uncharacterized membrane protein HdeD (DUF308 family)